MSRMKLVFITLIVLFSNCENPDYPTGSKTKKKKKHCIRETTLYYLLYSNDYRFSCNNPDYVKGINAKSLDECLSKRNESIIFNLGTVYSVCSSDEEGANG